MNPHTPQQDIPLKQLRQFGWLMGGVFTVNPSWPITCRFKKARS